MATKIFDEKLKIDKDYYNKKFTKINKKKSYIRILEIPTGVSGLAVGTFLSITQVGASEGVPIAGCISFLSSLEPLITNEYFSKLKLRYTKLSDWINMITQIL